MFDMTFQVDKEVVLRVEHLKSIDSLVALEVEQRPLVNYEFYFSNLSVNKCLRHRIVGARILRGTLHPVAESKGDRQFRLLCVANGRQAQLEQLFTG